MSLGGGLSSDMSFFFSINDTHTLDDSDVERVVKVRCGRGLYYSLRLPHVMAQKSNHGSDQRSLWAAYGSGSGYDD